MATDIKSTRKNTDYSASAVNLCNPPELQELLARLYEAQGNANEIKDRIDAAIPPELLKASEQVRDTISALNTEIRAVIEKYGSYQDVINGAYAIKQRKVSRTYNAQPFETNYPQFAPAVIIKAVDTTKLNGLIKGGLLTEEQLRQTGVLTETESYAYIIKV